MRIIDRYITRSILTTFFGLLFTFGFLFILIDTFTNLEDFVEKKVSLSIILKYYLSFIPIMMVQTSSVAILMAVMFTYAQLNVHNEIVAIRSSGMNFWQLARPALLISLLVSAGVFVINEKFVPQAANSNKELRESHIKVTLANMNQGIPIIKNLSFYGLKNRLYYMDTYNPNTKEVTNLTIIGHDQNQNLTEKIVALRGKWTGIAWKFYGVQTTRYDPLIANKPLEVRISDEKLLDIKETPEDFMQQRLSLSNMNLKQLIAYIERFKDSGATKTVNNLNVDMHYKIAFPIRNFIIILMGLPLALLSVGKRKAATFTAAAFALMIAFLYYVMEAVGLALAKGGAIPPVVGAWSAPVTFLITALAIIWKKF